MQAQNQNFSEFSRRTELLAEKLGKRLIDLPETLNISKAMLFAYRKGSYTISDKAWRKLEQAERAAGLAPPIMVQMQSAGTDEQKQEMLESASHAELFRSLPPEVRAMLARGKLDRLHVQMSAFLMDAEGLANQVEEFLENPTDEEMKRDTLWFAKKVKTDYRSAREVWNTVYESLRSRWKEEE